ncbi:MAG: ATP-grasp domain-containing protein [Sulfuricaulis sp.]|uniref:ATP-grasp domain-containing protein n=1 Tax=Sulfuricaulis sp. TaxID=2003553 RepID=UPI0025EE67DF|nr:ATP-grasp domain-containing protein [Sulfuricaulis sp.]MCR4346437.1 ATP-grasp domain-containing protein [Sulfuricaulis sp.]
MQNNSILFPVRQNWPATYELNSNVNAQDKKILKNSPRAAAPGILFTATIRWPIAARLAIAFANMGCRVEAICPGQHPVTTVRAIQRIYPYSVLKPLVSLRAAIESSAPDLVVPCDDDAAAHLHQLYERAGETGFSANALRVLIARSLGAPEACALATARGKLMALAAEERVRIPETTVVVTPSELTAWLAQHGFPAVIKLDSTWGGQGVSIVRDHEEAEHAFGIMTSRPSMVNGVARMLLERDPTFLLNSLKEPRRTITLQDFIPGSPANRAVACWQGQVLAGISVEAIRTQHPTGPATVVRVIENPEMSEAVKRLVRRLGISGLWGVDFILEALTGAAYLIEVNPRATPICHLPLGAGHNLPAALYTQLTGTPPLAPPAMTDHDVIAMFPGEWHRDPASSYLRTAYHDVPWCEPGLIQDCLDRPWSERGLIARLRARMRPKPAMLSIRHKDPTGAGAPTSVDYAHDHSSLNGFKHLASPALADKKTAFVR